MMNTAIKIEESNFRCRYCGRVQSPKLKFHSKDCCFECWRGNKLKMGKPFRQYNKGMTPGSKNYVRIHKKKTSRVKKVS